MREVLFRGKRLDNGEWVYGYYSEFHNRPIIDEPNSCQIFEPREDSYLAGSYIGGVWRKVDSDTVGQYIGINDVDGQKIFDGDVVNCKTTAYYFFDFVVKWSSKDARFVICKNHEEYAVSSDFDYIITGNIYDNSELLAANNG